MFSAMSLPALQQMRHGSAAQPPPSHLWHFGCNLHEWRHLVQLVSGFGLAVALPIVAAGAFFTPQLVTGSQSVATVHAIAADPAPAAEVRAARGPGEQLFGDDDDSDEASGFVDLYGNEVTDAIATYTLDQGGSLYELHSPQTELPRLGIPKS
jgi:hypothetical protein